MGRTYTPIIGLKISISELNKYLYHETDDEEEYVETNIIDGKKKHTIKTRTIKVKTPADDYNEDKETYKGLTIFKDVYYMEYVLGFTTNENDNFIEKYNECLAILQKEKFWDPTKFNLYGEVS